MKDAAGKPFVHQSLADTLINAEVLLPHEDSQAIARVVRRSENDEGRMICTFNENPLLNTLLYECEFNDGTTKEYAANTIASNMDLAVPCYITLSTITVQGRPLGWPTSTLPLLRELALKECARQLWDGNSLSNGPIAHDSGLT